MPTPVHCTDLEHSAWTYLTASGIVARRPCRLEGICVNASTDGGSVTLYSGIDAGAGRIIGVFKALKAVTMIQNLLPPVPCPNGIYATISGTGEKVTIFWSVL